MAHLSPDTFIDLLDGTLHEDAVPHLRVCEPCRAQLVELRQAWQAAAETDVPEPSPLFWDHLSRRVHDAVVADTVPVRRWWYVGAWGWFGLAGASVAALILTVTFPLLRGPVAPGRPAASSVQAVAGVPASLEPLPALEDDPSIGLVADLTSDMDVESALPELGLGARGAADRALSELDADERAELSRLLAEEMGTL